MQTSLMSDAAKPRPSPAQCDRRNIILFSTMEGTDVPDTSCTAPSWFLTSILSTLWLRAHKSLPREGGPRSAGLIPQWPWAINIFTPHYTSTKTHSNLVFPTMGLTLMLDWSEYAIYSLTNINVVNVMQSNFYFIDIFTLFFVIWKCF